MKKLHLPTILVGVAACLIGTVAFAAVGDVHTISGLVAMLLDPQVAGGFMLANGIAGIDPAKITDALERIAKEVKEQGAIALDTAKKSGDMSAESKEKIDKLLVDFGGLKERQREIEQKLDAKKSGGQDSERKSMGQMVIDDEQLKGMTSGSRKSVRIEMNRKDIMNVSGSVGTTVSSTNSLVPADRVGGIVMPPMRKMTIRDLVMPGETGSGSVEYVVETGFTNSSATVAEGGLKPKSDITFDLRTAPVRTIAHYFKASRQILDDAPQLRTYIDGRARYGLMLKEEQQLLSGDGTGSNILGLLPQSTAFVPSLTLTGATGIDRLRLAILQVILAEYPANGFVLNPIDWASIELTKDDNGNYIIAKPVDGSPAKLWNLPVVETQAMPQNSFLTGAFNIAAQIFDRMEFAVLLSTENQDDFIRNMVTILAEERLALAVYRPQAFVTGTVKPVV